MSVCHDFSQKRFGKPAALTGQKCWPAKPLVRIFPPECFHIFLHQVCFLKTKILCWLLGSGKVVRLAVARFIPYSLQSLFLFLNLRHHRLLPSRLFTFLSLGSGEAM
jgi:hypothetical protein